MAECGTTAPLMFHHVHQQLTETSLHTPLQIGNISTGDHMEDYTQLGHLYICSYSLKSYIHVGFEFEPLHV